MSLTEQVYASARRQYQPVPSHHESTNSFDLFDHSPTQLEHQAQPPPPPPVRNQQQPAFSSNNPFRRAPPPPASSSSHSHHQSASATSPFEDSFFSSSVTASDDANTRKYLLAAKTADPSFRSHSASNLDGPSPPSRTQPQATRPRDRTSVYGNPQFSNSDQSVFRANPGPSAAAAQPKPIPSTRRDVNSYLSHSSADSTSSVSSARFLNTPRTAIGPAATTRRKSTNPFLDLDEAPLRNRSAPAAESLIEVDNEDLDRRQVEQSRRALRNPNSASSYTTQTSHFDDSYTNKGSSRHLLRRTNSNDSIFATPSAPPMLTQKPKPERPSQATKPQYPNNRQSVYAAVSLEPPRSRHMRSNSDSSVMEHPPLRNSSGRREERRGSEEPRHRSSRTHEDRRYRDKESSSSRRHHHHSSSTSKDKKPSSSSRRSKKGVPLDTIDRLDVTGFFGPGNFHHDGPFDACTPHRNKHTKKAPVAAFPIDGANNTVSGMDPNRDRYAVENQIMGRDNEAFHDYSKSRSLGRSQDNPSTFDATLKAKPVHGNTTMGLGSSTFLDGAPAPRAAYDAYAAQQQGLSRKKSLAQRLRGGNGQGPPVVRRTSEPKVVTSSGAGPSSPDSSSPIGRTSPIGVPVTKTASGSKVPSTEVVTFKDSDQTPPKSNGLLRRVKSLKVGSSRRQAA